MQRHRFYAPPDRFEDSMVRLPAEEAHHLSRVVRLRPGDSCFVFDGRGNEFLCRVVETTRDTARLEIAEQLAGEVESPLRLTLGQALAKGEKFDLIVRKAVELGVTRIAPLVTDHVDVKLREESAKRRMERWQRIELEAVKQCGRRRLVEIAPPRPLAEFIEAMVSEAAQLAVFSEKGGEPAGEVLQSLREEAAGVALLIGPEGGWSDSELDLLMRHGARSITLGPRILRTETAALVAVSLAQYFLGDLSG